MPPGARQMMPANSAKMQQPSQMEMPRMPNGPVPSEWQSRINTPKSLPVNDQRKFPHHIHKSNFEFYIYPHTLW